MQIEVHVLEGVDAGIWLLASEELDILGSLGLICLMLDGLLGDRHVDQSRPAFLAARGASCDILERKTRLVDVHGQILVEEVLIAEVAAVAMMVAHVRLMVTDWDDVCSFGHSTLVLHRLLLLRHLGTVFALIREGAHLRLGAAARGLLHHDCIQLYFLSIEILTHVAQGGRGFALAAMRILRAELQQLSLHLR